MGAKYVIELHHLPVFVVAEGARYRRGTYFVRRNQMFTTAWRVRAFQRYFMS